MTDINKTAVDVALEKQRRESEARAILQDLERLITVPVERKRRWVWELIQNAKDCAPKDISENERFVNITFTLSADKLTFAHDGVHYSLEDLLAIVRRTSTKSYDNEEGNTGKFGTGFVTTHVLNKKVTVSGLLKNENGIREFSIIVDRTPDNLEALQDELKNIFGIINSIYESPPQKFDALPLTKYEYNLEPENFQLALDSLEELKKNLPFTLLINPVIKSITIIDETASTSNSYSIDKKEEISTGVFFSKLRSGEEHEKTTATGLLHYEYGKLILAVPVEKKDGVYNINQIEKQARLYREFPLIGTEHWQIPFFVQSVEFLPSEPRDGVRTLKENENKIDNTADENRATFIKYKEAVIEFFKGLKEASVERLFLLTESGLPVEKTEYTAIDWFVENIQKPLREFFLSYPLLKTAAGDFISIDKAKVPKLFSPDDVNERFYSIAVKFYGRQFPDLNSFKDWQRIISQDTNTWGDNIICTPEELVKDLNKTDALQFVSLEENETIFQWLNKLIGFIHAIGESGLGENNKLYPNQEGNLKLKQELQIDPGLNEKIKSIGNSLGLPVLSQLLHKDISHKEGISDFDVKGFFDKLNVQIGNLNPSASNKQSFEAVFQLVCVFTGTTAKERERWFQLVHELLPEMAPDKVVLDDMSDFNWSSAEKASLKYVCWLVENSNTFSIFSDTYFKQNQEVAYDWLNRLISILFRNQDYEELIRKYAVIPMQDDSLRKLDNNIYCEKNNAPFEELFKDMYTDFAGKGDPRCFLVHPSIKNDNLPERSAELITKPVDDLFAAYDADKKVEKDGPLNSLFHQLNEWIGEGKPDAELLFPHFSRQRPVLYIKAFGPEVSKMVMAIHKLNKPIEEIEALVNLNMTAAELELLKKASMMAGGTQKLLEVAADMEQQALEAAWRKKVGNAAEDAFKEAIAEIEAFDTENPDVGYDFEIMLPSGAQKYFLEIKSTVQFKENIKMSSRQGITARDNPSKYALCVLARLETNDEVTKEYFIEHAKFLTTVGELVSEKVTGIESGLNTIRAYKNGEEASSALENEQYAVFVGKKAWSTGVSFADFVAHLKNYFNVQ